MVDLDSTQREARAREVRHDVVAQPIVGSHGVFRILFIAQWAVAVCLAWVNAVPGESRVPFTLILGGVLSVPALLFVHASPQSAWVRHFVAICQMGWSTVFLWLLEGRPEAQFHVFVSLVFIAFYREWTVVLTATVVAPAYPVVRLMMLPESYAVSAAAWWHIADQGVWVIVEALVLLFTVHQTHRTADRFAQYAARLQLTNEAIGRDIHDRTVELKRSRDQQRLIADTTRAIPFELDPAQGRFTFVGPQALKVLGVSEARWQEPGFLDVLLPRQREERFRRQLDDCQSGTFEAVCSVVTADDRVLELRWTVSCELVDGRRFLRGLMIDISESRRLVREMELGQKLESVGRIAAGVAHEINTSVQSAGSTNKQAAA